MANEFLITHLVDKKATDELKSLQDEFKVTLSGYSTLAQELAKGIKAPVHNYDELTKKAKSFEEIQNKLSETEKKLNIVHSEYSRLLSKMETEIQSQVKAILDNAAANSKLNQSMNETNEIRRKTTNAISNELSEIQKENAQKREAYNIDQKALQIADDILGERQNNIIRLVQLNKELKQVAEEQKRLNEEEKKGNSKDVVKQRTELVSRERELKLAKQELSKILVNEEKILQSSKGSYQNLSLQLERLKAAYKQMNDEEKKSSIGQVLSTEIQRLDPHLKDLAAGMGEFQRNVGNYAKDNQSVRAELKGLITEIATLTIEYRALNDEEKKGAYAQEMSEKIKSLTSRASDLKDAIMDVNAEVSHGASDTAKFDAISQGANVLISGFGAAAGAAHLLGVSEKDLEEIQTDLQAAFVISNSLMQIQNALQKQSSLMKGIAILQEAAHTKAINLNTAAQSKNVIVSKAAIVTQKALTLVANANPYVLLATAILTVVGAFAAFASGASKAADQQKRLNEYEKEYQEYLKSRSEEMTRINEDNIKDYERELSIAKARNASLMETRALEDKIYRERLIIHNKQKGFYKDEVDSLENNRIQLSQYKDVLLQVQKMASEGKTKVSLKIDGNISKYDVKDAIEVLQGKIDLLGEKVKIGTEIVQDDAELKAKAQEEAAKRAQENRNIAENERKILRNAEDAKLNLIADSYERQREQTKVAYLRRIEDLTFQLNTESNLTRKARIAIMEQSVTLQKQLAKELSDIDRLRNEKDLEEIRKTEDLKISLMEEGAAKERAQAQADYTRQAQDINRMLAYSEELSETQVTELLEQLRLLGMQMQKEMARISIEESERQTERQLSSLETSALQEENILREKYRKGEINKENYEKELYKIGVKYAVQNIRVQIAAAEAELKLLDKDSEKAKALKENIDKLKAQIDKILGEAEENDYQERIDKFSSALSEMRNNAEDVFGDMAGLFNGLTIVIDKWAKSGIQSFGDFWDNLNPGEKAQMILQVTSQMTNGLTSMMNSLYDARIEALDKEQEANEKAYDREIERIEALQEKGAISTEEAEARKRAAEDKTKLKEEELAKKKAALQEKQAKWDKANNIVQTSMNTAVAVMAAWKMGPIIGAVFAALVAALGAAQLAAIIATPIPKYAKGTKDHPGGLAIVGDGGKKEGVITEKGLFVTPDKPTLVDLPKHAQVIPDLSFVYEHKGLCSDYFMLDKQTKELNEQGVVVNLSNDYSQLEKTVKGSVGSLQKSLDKSLKKIRHELDYKNISSRL
ncbi:hypothetical protein [Bacteroides intestinalis]|uniref:Phage tail tape measure protein n=1 Tax=Bacteroides intestinalis TaxID=329854 RepID=A0A139LPI6_9BACE|nr:hypothetical protein [Bacteroides intestinalis]KXT53359.1 hypothetical protein HMPREF2531_01399 [Bacteroides intestinalis]